MLPSAKRKHEKYKTLILTINTAKIKIKCPYSFHFKLCIVEESTNSSDKKSMHAKFWTVANGIISNFGISESKLHNICTNLIKTSLGICSPGSGSGGGDGVGELSIPGEESESDWFSCHSLSSLSILSSLQIN